MNWFQSLFQKKSKARLGIDLGSSTVKLVESLPEEGKLKLETYGLAYFSSDGLKIQSTNTAFFEDVYSEQDARYIGRTARYKSEKEGAEAIFKRGPAHGSIFDVLSNKEIGKIIRELCAQAKVQANTAYFSMPVFTTFSTVIDLPVMPVNELAAAIPYEARKYIPIPLDEVELDWMLVKPAAEIKETMDQSQSKSNSEIGSDQNAKAIKKIQVILVAILKEAIDKYLQIAKIANLGVLALEPESFSLARSLTDEAQEFVILFDVGSSFSDIILIRRGTICLVQNAKKRVIGESNDLNKEVLADRIKETVEAYQSKYPKQKIPLENIKCVLTGGSAITPSLVDFLKGSLDFEVVIGNPFSKFDYPGILEPALREIGPALSVAAGLAMRE